MVTVTKEEIFSSLVAVIDQILEEQGGDDVLTSSLLVDDLGFSSIDFVELAVAIETDVGQKLGFQKLLMKDGAYVEDLSVEQVVNFVFNQLSGTDEEDQATSVESTAITIDENDKVTAEKFAEFKKIIRPISARSFTPTTKLPNSVFVLSPPRSGSTLFRMMLAGSPSLFVPPELHLLTYNTMAERFSALNDEHNEHLLEGTVRAMMHLKGWSAEQARDFASECERNGMTSQKFYEALHENLDGRILVDKTPTYSISRDVLERAETDFADAKYIHLVRHPCGTIRSYEESKLTRMMPLMSSSSFSTRSLAEMTWLVCHQNILAFTQKVPRDRVFRVHYESLVTQPEATIKAVCDFLGIAFDSQMLDPYQDHSTRMADGVDVASKMSGDIKFHLHKGIDSASATRWKKFYSEEGLGTITKNVAKVCGYSFA